jgi:platelet-activating factor acetylhydrolase IB subunit beta/gamma
MGYKIRYARALARADDFSAAEHLFSEVRREHPDNPVLLSSISEMQEWRGDLKGALAIAEQLVAAHPGAGVYEQRVAYLTTRRRIATVASGVAHMASRSIRGPLSGLYRRMRAGLSAGRKAPVEILTTTTPSPPPFVHSWLRHVDLVRDAPTAPVDVMLVGDSHVQYWPDSLWRGRALYNFGVAADKTQHIVWRLLALPDAAIEARHVVIMAGVNNLGADDTAAGMAAGILEVLAEIERVAPGARIRIVAIPPCGETLDFRDRERRRANALIRDRRPSEFVEIDESLRTKQDGAFVCYQEDFIHLSPRGYEVLTDLLLARLAS